MGPNISLLKFNHGSGCLAFVEIKYMKIKVSEFLVQKFTVNANLQEGKQCPSRYIVVDTLKFTTYLVNI